VTVTDVVFADTAEGVSPEQLEGFFAGWPNPPSAATLLRILNGSAHVVLARDGGSGRVVGFITAVSDGISAAYIPHLEVLKEMQGQGIGSELARRMVAKLRSLYMVDLVCDSDLQPFYERLGFRPYSAMIIRNYERQRCE
jgi:ribosomal protein S18 acetylase RimI-like enzyme